MKWTRVTFTSVVCIVTRLPKLLRYRNFNKYPGRSVGMLLYGVNLPRLCDVTIEAFNGWRHIRNIQSEILCTYSCLTPKLSFFCIFTVLWVVNICESSDVIDECYTVRFILFVILWFRNFDECLFIYCTSKYSEIRIQKSENNLGF